MPEKMTPLLPSLLLAASGASLPALAQAVEIPSRTPHVSFPDTTKFRGSNYVPSDRKNSIDQWRYFNETKVQFELSLGQKAGFNFLRVFLNAIVFEQNNAYDFSNLDKFIEIAKSFQIGVMPILFDGCSDATLLNVEPACINASYTPQITDSSAKCWLPSPGYTRQNDAKEWGKIEVFVKKLQDWFRPERTSNLPVLWDVYNEPECAGKEHNWQFVEHFVDVMISNDEEYLKTRWNYGYPNSTHSNSTDVHASSDTNISSQQLQVHTNTDTPLIPITYGAGSAGSLVQLKPISQKLDILSFHTYHSTWKDGVAVMEYVRNVQKMFSSGNETKQIFNSETGCYSLANPYDVTIRLHDEYGIGFTIWEVMVSTCIDCADRRRNRTGLFYEDGSVRDPFGILAVQGLYGPGFRERNSDSNSDYSMPPPVPAVPYNPLESGAASCIQFCAWFLQQNDPSKISVENVTTARIWTEVLVNYVDGVGGSTAAWPLRWDLRNGEIDLPPAGIDGVAGYLEVNAERIGKLSAGFRSGSDSAAERFRISEGGNGNEPAAAETSFLQHEHSGNQPSGVDPAEVARIQKLMRTALPSLKGMLLGEERSGATCAWENNNDNGVKVALSGGALGYEAEELNQLIQI